MSNTTFQQRSMMLILSAAVLISGFACTTTRTIDPRNQSAMSGVLNPGDTVKVTLQDGRELELTFVDDTVDHIVGRDRTDSVRRIARQEVLALWWR